MNQTFTELSVLDRLKQCVEQLERWEPEIRTALRHGGNAHNFDDVVQMVLSNRLMFFSWDDAFTVMEVITYPRFKVFHCFLAGGKLSGVIASIEPMSKLGRELGCRYLSMAGRKGWAKELGDRGWRHVTTTMYKDIAQ